MTTQITARIDAASKERARKILNCLGLSMSEAIELYMKQIILHRGIPFEIKLPNKTTLQAIEELEAGGGEKFSTVKDLFEDLEC
jgi:DNA-damage-inducible protein J